MAMTFDLKMKLINLCPQLHPVWIWWNFHKRYV